MYVYIHILKFRLFSPYVTCMYVFRTDCLALNNQLMCSSMGKTSSLSSKFLQLPMVLCEGLKPHGLLLYLLWLVQRYHTCSVHGWAVMLVTLDVASCITRRHNSTKNSKLLTFHNFTQWQMGDERPRVSLLEFSFGCEAHWTVTNIPNSWQGLLLFLPRILKTPMNVLQRVFKDTKSECKLLI